MITLRSRKKLEALLDACLRGTAAQRAAARTQLSKYLDRLTAHQFPKGSAVAVQVFNGPAREGVVTGHTTYQGLHLNVVKFNASGHQGRFTDKELRPVLKLVPTSPTSTTRAAP